MPTTERTPEEIAKEFLAPHRLQGPTQVLVEGLATLIEEPRTEIKLLKAIIDIHEHSSCFCCRVKDTCPEGCRCAGDAPRATRPEIICLCGSSRFVAQMAIMAWEFEKEGKIAMSLHLLPSDYPGVASDHQAEAEGVSEAMDELHLRKIDLADRVFIVNINGYIGDSTRNEIRYAREHGKPIVFFEQGRCRMCGGEGSIESIGPGPDDRSGGTCPDCNGEGTL